MYSIDSLYNMLADNLIIAERTMTHEPDRKGCLMAMVNPRSAGIIQNWSKKYIPDDILYREGSDFGRETETHITILYGFTQDLTPTQVQSIIQGTRPFQVRVIGTRVFQNPKYDVVVLSVESPELSRLNKLSKKFPYTTNYPTYNPHLTLAYVLPGRGSKYNNISAQKITSILCDSIVYSGINREKRSTKLLQQEGAFVNPPPAIQQQSFESNFSADFVNFIKNLENAQKSGFIKGKWYPHPSAEGNNLTIAYGHKIKTDKESQKFAKGIDDREAIKLLVKDLLEAKEKVRRYIDERYKIHLMLDKKQMEMLTEFAFNLGGLDKFPKFTDAVLRKDWGKAAQEYKRSYRSSSGEKKSLTRRNQLFFDRYLK